RHIGALTGPDVFHPGRSGRTALRIAARPARIPGQRVEEVLELVGLGGAAHRRAGGYSQGMRQRLALAAALLGDPETLVLDEPANGLDPEGVHWLRGLLRGLADQGRTVFVSSHLLAELAQTVDDVVLINHGRLVAAKLIAAALTGASVGLLAEALSAATSAAALSAHHVPLAWSQPGVLGAVAAVPLLAALFGMLGVGLGLLLRNTAAALGLALMW